MTVHTEYALRRSCIAKILDLAFAVAAAETSSTESLVARENSKVLDLIAAGAAAVRAVVANEGPVA